MIILENDYSNSGEMIIPANTTGANRICVPGKEKAAGLTVAAGKSITLIYDARKSSWKIINWQNG